MKELERVVLKIDIPEKNLQAGDVGTIVLVHDSPKGYEVEFCALNGETFTVESLLEDQVRPIAPGEIAHARAVST